MAYSILKGAPMLHVFGLGSLSQDAVIRSVTVQLEPKPTDMHVRCWISGSMSSQLLPTFELYPDTEAVKAELGAIIEATEAIKLQQRKLAGMCYELRNRVSRGEF